MGFVFRNFSGIHPWWGYRPASGMSGIAPIDGCPLLFQREQRWRLGPRLRLPPQ